MPSASLLPQEWFCTLRQEVVGTSLTCHPRLFPDASLVKASAAESRSAMQVAPLEISDS